MDKASVERLRFDRRLQNRSGWVDPSDREAFLESLPDVSDKMTTLADEEAESAPESAAPPSPSEASLERPAPVAGDFSTPSPFGTGRDEPS